MVSKEVSKFQNAFVEGRQILNVVLIENEAIDSMLKSNSSRVLCKLDIEKAVENLEELAFEVGLKVDVLPTTYLGLPLGAPHNSLVAWDRVEERIHGTLEGKPHLDKRKGGFRSQVPSFAQQSPPMHLNNWEIDMVECFLARLQDKVVVKGGKAKVC
ncbi:hypothetical protein CK203_099669 [Vitis vinifera]|uniref:Uncharacterized protein n=1 Tax=Vitis vinifera TaxID=29760 RepID=A0A438F1N6_VITVI|nr:hypothetical protein CK203_099669 [Vitis vinifera]